MSTSKQPDCDELLSATQVRNPKLKRNKDGNSWIESAPWSLGDTFGYSLLSGTIATAPVYALLGGLDIFVDYGWNPYFAPVLVFTAVFLHCVFSCFIAPTIWKPIELGSQERKSAYESFHRLPVDRQLEVQNAFEHYMSIPHVTGVDYTEARDLWVRSYNTLQEREKMLEVEEQKHPRLEEARQDLERLQSHIQELEKST